MRHIAGEGYRTISRVLKVSQSSVVSIVGKFKKYGTTQTLPRACRPTKLRNQARRTLVREVTKNAMNTPEFLGCDGRTCQKDKSLQYFTNLGFMGEWPDDRHS
jgi:hypothetical protein